MIRPLTFNGLCNATGNGRIPSLDRFYIGGPGELRGFIPAGIVPKANKGGSGIPGGDSQGRDLFHAFTLATSIPIPSHLATLRQNGARLFGVVNAGTCISASGGHSLV